MKKLFSRLSCLLIAGHLLIGTAYAADPVQITAKRESALFQFNPASLIYLFPFVTALFDKDRSALETSQTTSRTLRITKAMKPSPANSAYATSMTQQEFAQKLLASVKEFGGNTSMFRARELEGTPSKLIGGAFFQNLGVNTKQVPILAALALGSQISVREEQDPFDFANSFFKALNGREIRATLADKVAPAQGSDAPQNSGLREVEIFNRAFKLGTDTPQVGK